MISQFLNRAVTNRVTAPFIVFDPEVVTPNDKILDATNKDQKREINLERIPNVSEKGSFEEVQSILKILILNEM